MKKLKQIIKILVLSILLLSTNCNRQFEMYVLENNINHSLKIDFFRILQGSSGEFLGREFSGTIHLPARGSVWEFSIDVSRGGGVPVNAFSDFFEGQGIIDSATVIYNGERVEIHVRDGTRFLNRNLFHNESYIINGDEHRYIFTEEDYNNAEVIEE